MASNFDFLKEHWAFLLPDARKVEADALCDPRTAAFYARRLLENALHWLYDNDSALKAPHKMNLAAMIYAPSFKSNIKQGLFQDIRFIHKLGNLAVHDNRPISNKEGLNACGAVFRFTGWLARVYTRGGAAPGNFNIALLPKASKTEQSRELQNAAIIELKKAREALDKKEQQEKAALAKQQQTEAELKQLQEKLAELQAVKQQNLSTIGSDEYSEAVTRDVFIDVMLREAGWNPQGENVEEYEVVGMPTVEGKREGKGYVDYVLWGDDGLPLAVVEAKKTKVDSKVGKHQAELYADCLTQQFEQRPIIFYSNGYTTWLWDDRNYPPRKVEGFYTKDQLQLLINRRTSQKGLTTQQVNTNITDRPYSFEAAARVMQRFDTHRQRKALVVMATGTGKTRLSIALVEMLLKANWVRRVLFLADRIALVGQAKRAYKKFLPNVTVANLLEKTDQEARILFSTYPTMMNLIDGSKKDQQETFSVGHFDLVIIDEAHRSVYQKYGAIFEYFDSLLLGLTATPRGEVDRNTYHLFDLQDHQPTYYYELSEAVEDGYLVPPKALSVPLKFQRDGIKYSELSADEQAEYEEQESFYDEQGELRESIGSAALNKWLFNSDTVDKVLKHLMEHGLKVDDGDKLGKTIIFAKNSAHAEFIVERFDANYPHLKGKFCQKIDFSVKYAQGLIDTFSVPVKMPQIAVSVDMLDTGIDVPEIVNLVFFKLVRSKTKFWQMIGRGTRLCPDLFGSGIDKTCFYVFDYCQNLEFFETNPEGFDAPPQRSAKQAIFERRLQLAQALQELDQPDPQLATFGLELKDQLHSIVSGLNLDNFIVRRQRQLVETYADRKRWDQLSEQDVNELNSKVSGLPTADEDDVTARRFDLLVINWQIAKLMNAANQTRYQEAIRQIANNLEQSTAIPSVAAQLELILDSQKDHWWQDATLPMLESVRLALRDLVKFVDSSKQQVHAFTNFADELAVLDSKKYDLVQHDPNMIDYRRRIKKIIQQHNDHLTIRRLRDNQPISLTDIAALEEILFTENEGISKPQFEEIYGDQPVGVLVRSIVGLSRKAAKEAFAAFLSKSPLHPDQITFLNEVVEYLVQNGVMPPKQMFNAPFTKFHDQGVAGVLGQELAAEVVDIVKRINQNATLSESEASKELLNPDQW